jgi:hypothetical protein
MNDLSPAGREAEMSMLIEHEANIEIADAVLRAVGMDDTEAQNVLNAHNLHRECAVSKASLRSI